MNANKQQQAIALLGKLLCVRPQRRKELLREQFSFVAVIRGEEIIVAHSEFFMEGDTPFHEATTTTQGVCFRNVLTGATVFVPFDLAPAPVAAPAPAVVSTRSRRVSFGEELTFWNSDFSKKLEFIAPSSGAVIEEVFADGKVVVTFVGATRLTWTI